MTWWTEARYLFRKLNRKRSERETEEEIQTHLELEAREKQAAGLSAEEARLAARRAFGSIAVVKERGRVVWGFGALESFWRDLRFGARMLCKNPLFTAVSVISLMLGISANTTIFSIINALLLSPPPVEKPAELRQIWKNRTRESSEIRRYGVWARPQMAFLRAQNQSFASMGAFNSEPELMSWNHNGLGESIQTILVTGNFFEICGLRPAMGRFFSPEEDRTPGAYPAAVISNAFWRERLEADPQAIGRTIVINDVSLTVIGVAPAEFHGLTVGIAPDVWVPLMMGPSILHDAEWLTRTNSQSLIGIGRLKDGVKDSQAAAELTTLVHQFEARTPGDYFRGDGATLTPAQMTPTPLRKYVSAFTGTLMGAVILVLLIACANAANLQLARASARRQEMAVRAALGASRSRLLRQTLTESVLLSCLGGALGVALSIWLMQLIVRLIPSTLPVRLDVALDWRVLLFTAAVSLATGIVFGLAPALAGTKLDLVPAIKGETRGSASYKSRLANLLIIGQLSLCLVLLVGATLCLRSLYHAYALSPGFEAKGRVTARFKLNDFGYTQAQAQDFYARLISRAQTLPGVRAAALTGHLPLGTETSNGVLQIEGQSSGVERSGFFFEQFSVGPGYFQVIGARILQGREFNGGDRAGASRVAVINEAAATRYWPGQNPIGRRIFDGAPIAENARTIVGVVETGRYQTLGEDPKPAYFECFLQSAHLGATLVVHTESATQSTIVALRNLTQELDPRLALTGVTTLEQHLSLALFPVRASGLLLAVLGFAALALAISGLFGVIAYSVSRRTREFGVRIALGARREEILRLVLRQGLRLAAIGIGVGLTASAAATQFLESFLFGVSPLDPITFLLIPLFLLGAVLFALWLPARRAAQVDPIIALRSE